MKDEARRPVAIPATLLALGAGGIVAVVVGHYSAHPYQAAAAAITVLILGTVTMSVVLVPWRSLPTPRADQATALAELPREHVARSKQLHRAVRPASIGAGLATFVLICAIGLTPLGAEAIGWLGELLDGSQTAQIAMGVVAISLAGTLITLPFEMWKHTVFVRFGTSSQPWKAWFIDRLKGFALGIVANALILGCIYITAWLEPDWWWLWASVLIAMLLLGVGFTYPQVIAPIFYKFTLLEDGELRDRLLALAKLDGVEASKIFVVDASRHTTAHNAAVLGHGPFRRILVFDNLLTQPQQRTSLASDDAVEEAMGSMRMRGATHDEITTVVAHELAHAKYHDVLGGLILQVMQFAILICGLYLLGTWDGLLHLAGVESITDGRAQGLLLLVIMVFGIVIVPFNNLLSRRVEAAADAHALRLTNDPASFISAWQQIVQVNLADPNPSRMTAWFSKRASHPTIVSRIAMAYAFARQAQAK